MRRILMLVIGLGVLTTVVLGATPTRSVTYHWSPPKTGNPVNMYRGYLSDNGGTTWTLAGSSPDTMMTVQQTLLKTYIFRVEGVDALNQTGTSSDPSDPYTPSDGPPGAPGKPRHT